MFGIKWYQCILCERGGMHIFLPMQIMGNPVIKPYRHDINILLQKLTIDHNNCALAVHKFSVEELEQCTFNKLCT